MPSMCFFQRKIVLFSPAEIFILTPIIPINRVSDPTRWCGNFYTFFDLVAYYWSVETKFEHRLSVVLLA
jgi:hypothetical protein